MVLAVFKKNDFSHKDTKMENNKGWLVVHLADNRGCTYHTAVQSMLIELSKKTLSKRIYIYCLILNYVLKLKLDLFIQGISSI